MHRHAELLTRGLAALVTIADLLWPSEAPQQSIGSIAVGA